MFSSTHRSAGTSVLDRASTVAGRLLVIGVAAAAALWVVHRLQFVILALVLGFAQVAMLGPVAAWLRARRVPRPLAAVLAVACVGTAAAGLTFVAVHEVVRNLPAIRAAVRRAVAAAGPGPAVPGDDGLAAVREHAGSLLSRLAGALGDSALDGFSLLGSMAAAVVVSVMFTVFALAGGPSLWRSITGLVAPPARPAVHAAGKEALRVAGSWFSAATLTGLVDALGIGLGVALLRVPLAGAIAILTFVLSFLPMVGATLAGAVAVAVALVFKGPATALAVALIVLVVQQVESHVLAPLLMSRAVSFHPLTTLLLTTVMSVLLGVVGMFLAVPLAGAAVGAYRAYRSARHPSVAPLERSGVDDAGLSDAA